MVGKEGCLDMKCRADNHLLQAALNNVEIGNIQGSSQGILSGSHFNFSLQETGFPCNSGSHDESCTRKIIFSRESGVQIPKLFLVKSK